MEGATWVSLDLGQEHKAALEAHQTEAARQAALDNLQRRETLRQVNDADRAAVGWLLAVRRGSDRAEGQAESGGQAVMMAVGAHHD